MTTEFTTSLRHSQNKTGATVYWDLDNCSVPNDLKAYQLVMSIKKFVSQSEGNLTSITAFGNTYQLGAETRNELQQSGVTLQDTVTNRTPVEVSILVELLKLTCDHTAPHKIILICGNRNLGNALEILVFRGYEVLLVHTTDAPESLTKRSSFNYEWRRFLSRYSPIGAHLSTSSTPAAVNVTAPPSTAPTSRSPPEAFTSDSPSVLLKEVLAVLKKEMFRPTEKTIEASLKRTLVNQGRALTSDLLDRIMATASRSPDFKVFGTKPKRVIYEANDIYGGIDPIYPPKVDYEPHIWNDFKTFLYARHPISKNGRYRFAEYLRRKGPASISELPLAQIAQLVELAIVRKILCFKGGVICSVAPPMHDYQQSIPFGISSSSSMDVERVKTEIVSFLQSRGGKAQIGTLSGHLIQVDMMSTIKAFGGLKGFIDETKVCKLEKDVRHGLFVILERTGDEEANCVQIAHDFVLEQGGRINIGTLSSFLRRNGTLMRMKDFGGMKHCLENSKLFAFESDAGNSTFVRLLRPGETPPDYASIGIDFAIGNDYESNSPQFNLDSLLESNLPSQHANEPDFSIPSFGNIHHGDDDDDLEPKHRPIVLNFGDNNLLDFSELMKQLTELGVTESKSPI